MCKARQAQLTRGGGVGGKGQNGLVTPGGCGAAVPALFLATH